MAPVLAWVIIYHCMQYGTIDRQKETDKELLY